MIREICKNILLDLERHRGTSQEELFFQAVTERLNTSFESYQHDLNVSLDYLQRRNEITVARKINRLK